MYTLKINEAKNRIQNMANIYKYVELKQNDIIYMLMQIYVNGQCFIHQEFITHFDQIAFLRAHPSAMLSPHSPLKPALPDNLL
jgi:hypothetical protein